MEYKYYVNQYDDIGGELNMIMLYLVYVFILSLAII